MKTEIYHFAKTFWLHSALAENKVILTTRMGLEPTRAVHIGLAVQRLNHSATSSVSNNIVKVCLKTLFGTLRHSQDQSIVSVRLYLGRAQTRSN